MKGICLAQYPLKFIRGKMQYRSIYWNSSGIYDLFWGIIGAILQRYFGMKIYEMTGAPFPGV